MLRDLRSVALVIGGFVVLAFGSLFAMRAVDGALRRHYEPAQFAECLNRMQAGHWCAVVFDPGHSAPAVVEDSL